MVRAAPSLLLGLAPGGGYLAASIAGRAGGLLHHLFTLTQPHLQRERRKGGGGMSLWPDPAAMGASPPRPGCYPAPCSVECGLSSGRLLTSNPPGQPGVISSYHKKAGMPCPSLSAGSLGVTVIRPHMVVILRTGDSLPDRGRSVEKDASG